MSLQIERLRHLCDQLHLLHVPDQLAHLGQNAAKKGLGYLDFLEQVLHG